MDHSNLRSNFIDFSGLGMLPHIIPIRSRISSEGLESTGKSSGGHGSIFLPNVGVCGVGSGELGVDSGAKQACNSGKRDLLTERAGDLPMTVSCFPTFFKLSTYPGQFARQSGSPIGVGVFGIERDGEQPKDSLSSSRSDPPTCRSTWSCRGRVKVCHGTGVGGGAGGHFIWNA